MSSYFSPLRPRLSGAAYYLVLCTAWYLIFTRFFTGLAILFLAGAYQQWHRRHRSVPAADNTDLSVHGCVSDIAAVAMWLIPVIGGPLLLTVSAIQAKLCGAVVICCGLVWDWLNPEHQQSKRTSDPFA